MFGSSFDPRRSNVIVGVALLIAIFATCRFVAALMGASTEGEVAGALGSFVGGVIGAGGAVFAVYLALSAQRADDTIKVSTAVRTEVGGLAVFIIGAVQICQEIANNTRQVPRRDAGYILRKMFVEPVVYEAVADRIALLPRPDATVRFYLRLSEAKAMVQSLEMANIEQEFVSADNALVIADSLITALQLAQAIISDGAEPRMAAWVGQVTVDQITECLQSARRSFPTAESFQPPPDA